jgi:hypothetical protein
MLYDLVEVAPQRVGQLFNLGSRFMVDGYTVQNVLQFIDQFGGDAREIIDEVERVLDLVRDAGGELAERGELFGLNQAILRGAQILQRGGQLARARLHAVKQPHVLDCDCRLVSKGCNQLDLLIREWPHVRTGQG